MNLHELAPVMGSTHVNKRKGRGTATGNGKTAGRGHKGQKARSGGKYITIGVKHSEKGAYYANPVEKGHGGPGPAPAHPFVRPAFDVRKDEAYQIMKNILKDELLK